MNIIIVGAGRIGKNLSKSLSDEKHKVYLIENNDLKAEKAKDKLDVQLVFGSGSDPETLKKANAPQADLVLAVTTSDETNMVVCFLAHLLGAKRCIARVRNISLSHTLEASNQQGFFIDEMINPELVTAGAIVKTIETPGAAEVADFADGKINLRGFHVNQSSPLCGVKISDLRDEDFPWPFLIVSIIRNEAVVIPSGNTIVEDGDYIYVLLPKTSLGEFLTYVDPEIKMPKKVVIYGATITGKHVAMALADKVRDIILIEEDEEKASEIAGELTNVRVIKGNPSEADILTECGIEAADAFVGASNDDHANLIGSVLAKEMGARSTIIVTQQTDYVAIADTLGIDSIINPHYLAAEQILHLVRGKNIRSVAKLQECDAETIELVPEEGSAVTTDALKNLKFPKNAIVGAVVSGSAVQLANGDTRINPGDKVIAFCQQAAIVKLQEMFARKK